MAGRNVNGVAPDELARRGRHAPFPRDGASSRTSRCARTSGWPPTPARRMAEIEETAYARFPRLGERRKQLAGTMSGGEQQMLAMARGLASDPALLCSTSCRWGWPRSSSRSSTASWPQIAATGVSILVVEQFARTVLGVADVAAIMVHGRIRQVGTPTEIESSLSAAYLGG